MTKKTEKKEQELIKDINEETNQVKKLLIIIISLAIIAGLLYFVSAKYLVKDNFQNKDDNNSKEESIAYDRVDVGNVFNRPYDEYYVLAYEPSSLKASIYASYMDNFKKENSKIYYLNLSLDVNKKYVGEETNKNATKASELVLKEPTLIKIKNGKIQKYLEDLDSIDAELK